MDIPVFLSCPSALNPEQLNSKEFVVEQLDRFGLRARTLGQSDYAVQHPLREVFVIAKNCAGGVILGFEQFRADCGTFKRGTGDEQRCEGPVSFPTMWNHLEAGILFGLKLPILIFKERQIDGGVFDRGATDVFVHDMPSPEMSENSLRALEGVFLKWQAKVREHYYIY